MRLAAIALVTSLLGAQQTWTVPSGANVDTYIAQASPGDLLVLSGGYYVFTVSKGLTILGNGSSIAGVVFQVPPGQRASLSNVTMTGPGFPYSGGSISVLGGQVALANVGFQGRGRLDVTAGEVVVQGISGSCSLGVDGGRCSVTDSVLIGSSAAWDYNFGSIAALPGLRQTGGQVVVSHSDLRGGDGGVGGSMFPIYLGAAAGLRQDAGFAWLSDCTTTGGAGPAALLGQPAVEASGTTAIARTTMTDGALAAGPSSGWQAEPEMVGLTCSATPVRGTSFVVTAKAGTAQDVMGIVGGFTRYSNLVPPVVEPLFVDPSQMVGLALSVPSSGGTLSTTVNVPNLVALYGSEVWLQAVQLAGVSVRASTVVGGTIH